MCLVTSLLPSSKTKLTPPLVLSKPNVPAERKLQLHALVTRLPLRTQSLAMLVRVESVLLVSFLAPHNSTCSQYNRLLMDLLDACTCGKACESTSTAEETDFTTKA